MRRWRVPLGRKKYPQRAMGNYILKYLFYLLIKPVSFRFKVFCFSSFFLSFKFVTIENEGIKNDFHNFDSILEIIAQLGGSSKYLQFGYVGIF